MAVNNVMLDHVSTARKDSSFFLSFFLYIVMQRRAQEGAKVAWATARLPSSTEVAPPKEIYIYF